MEKEGADMSKILVDDPHDYVTYPYKRIIDSLDSALEKLRKDELTEHDKGVLVDLISRAKDDTERLKNDTLSDEYFRGY